MPRDLTMETDMSKPAPKTKRALLAQLLNRKSGASINALQDQLGWQPHTIRAEISRIRKSGLIVTCAPSPKGAVYRAQAQPVALADT